jgi:hypothetical protein
MAVVDDKRKVEIRKEFVLEVSECVVKGERMRDVRLENGPRM